MASIPRSPSTQSELNDFTEENGKKVYNVSRSRLIGLINWVQVFQVYLPVIARSLVVIMTVQILLVLYQHRFDFQAFYDNEVAVVQLRKPLVLDLGWQTIALLLVVLYYLSSREKAVYLIDFATFEPPESWKLSPEQLLEVMRRFECFTPESLEFQERMLKQSGVGPATGWPPGTVQVLKGLPVDRTAEASRKEAETVIFDCVRRLLKATNTKASAIDVLVINCSLFSPTPSLCSMVINEFKMRPDISSYNLSGMGCSAGLISMDLVKNILAGRPYCTALVVSTEIISQKFYNGNDRAFLLQNTLFRVGGAAVLLSNKWVDALRARFKLLHLVRTQLVGEDSMQCVFETEDDSRFTGVRLSKDIVKIAGRAMEKNFTTLGPYVLPLSEQVKTGFWMVARMIAKKLNLGKVGLYIPDFKRGIDHFCIHAGGRGVIDGIEKNLNLNPSHVEASRHTLYKYGNTSSSSIWYELDYIRTRMSLKSGQRVLQIAFGSGFKCNSSVWLCLRNTKSKTHEQSQDTANADVKKKD